MAAVTLGIGGVAGVIGVTAGTAGALTATSHVAAATNTQVASTGTTQHAGNLTVKIHNTSTTIAVTGDTLSLALSSSPGTEVWHTATATVGGVAAVTSGLGTSTLHVTVGGIAISSTAAVVVSGITYNTTGVGGTIRATGSNTVTAGAVKAMTPTFADNAHSAVPGPSTGNGITASSAPTVAKTGTAQKAGTLTITLRGTASTNATATHLDLTTTVGAGNAYWNSATITATGVNASFSSTATKFYPTPANTTITEVSITLGDLATGNSATIKLTGVKYNTRAAIGTVTVTPKWVNTKNDVAATVTYGTFTPSSAVNAVATHTTPATHATTHTLEATTTTPVGKGVTGAAVGNWTLSLAGTKTEGWTKTTTMTITVLTPANANCTTSLKYVVVTGTPKATVGTTKTVSTTPTVSVSTAPSGSCTVNDHNVVSVTFTNSGTFSGATGAFSISLSGVKYSIGKTTTTGNVYVEAGFTGVATTTIRTDSNVGSPTGPSNADVTLLYVTANTPAVNVPKTALDAAISPINLVETAAAQVKTGDVCIALTPAANKFNTAATAAAKVANTGDGKVTPKVTYETSTGTAATTAASATYAVFKVTGTSTKTATTYEVSGLAVNASSTPGAVTAKVYPATGTNCDVTVTLYGTATAFTVQNTSTQIYGQTADATASKLLESRFTATATNCPGTLSPDNRPVVLATTANFPDALSSQYLAGYLKTGTLLTPTAKLSTVTLQALRTEGITNVYVIGGPLAVSATVVNQLMTTPAYNCGGTAQLKTGTHTEYIQVTRIYGQTQYDTAQKVAQFVPSSDVASVSVVGSYAGTNATGGTGKYNQTKGSASTAPSTGAVVPTAILASGVHFQDAMSASAMGYKPLVGSALGFPILLTTTTTLPTAAKGAIANLGIKQVILMGGQLAVTNTVETSLQALGVSVLRIAGQTYTATATDLATFELNETTGGIGLGWLAGTATHLKGTVTVARGNGFTDGLAGAVISGFHQEPLVLTETPTTVGQYLTTFLKEAGKTGTGIGTATNKKHLTTLVVFGGPDAVSPAAISAMETDLSN